MDIILTFKKDLDNYPTSSLNILQRYLGLPTADQEDLLWMIAIYQANKRLQYVKMPPGYIQFGKYYRSSEKLGSGALGDVYLGQDETGKPLAIKIINGFFNLERKRKQMDLNICIN